MATQDSPRPRRRVLALLPLVVLLVALAGATVAGARAVDRLRVDTPVEAVAQGEPGCVTSATFTDPGGTARSVDVTTYKSNCLDLDPGATVTVFYDRDDPSVVASSRAWGWSAIAAVAALALAGVAARGLWTDLAALRAARRGRGLSS